VRLASLALWLTLLAACAGPAALAPGVEPDVLGERLASRAASLLGQAAPFTVRGERYPADCSGFVEAVYAAEGIPLRGLMVRSAPRETSAAAALHRAALDFGEVFGGGGEWPRPGDLVFWHGTYDRDRDGRSDDRFTHVGIVEYVAGGTVVFLHRGSREVVRGAMTPSRPGELAEGDRLLNSALRRKARSAPGDRLLAGELFAGYGRIDPRRVPRELRVARGRY
jgi:hypothetical protein